MDKKQYLIVAIIILVDVLVVLLARQTVSSPGEDEQVTVKCAGKTVFRNKYLSKIFPVLINYCSTK